MAGYSGTPLTQKLGIKPGHRVLLVDAPEAYLDRLQPLPVNVDFQTRLDARTDVVQVFVKQRSTLSDRLIAYRPVIRPNAMIWVSWPKKASGLATDITENVIREVALPLGFVDIKVCAVDSTWSGLKLVIRKEFR